MAANDQEVEARGAHLPKIAEDGPASVVIVRAAKNQRWASPQRLKELSAVAAMLEKYPRLADAVDKGMDH